MRRGGRGPSSPLKLTPPTPHERMDRGRLGLKRPHDSSSESDALNREWLVSSQAAGMVDLSEELKELASHRCVRLVRQGPKGRFEPRGLSVDGVGEEKAQEPLELFSLDSDVGVPTLVAHGVAEGLEWNAAKVPHPVPFGLKERVLAVSSKECEELSEPKVLDARLPGSLSSRPRPLGDINVELVDQLGIDPDWVLAVRHDAQDVEEVAVGDVRDGELLDEARHARTDA